MSMRSPAHAKDGYKVGHPVQYPKDTQEVYSNFTARSGNHSNIPGTKGVYFVGLQILLAEYFVKDWNENFFAKPKEDVVGKYQRRVSNYLGYSVDVSHIEALHDLGYLPLHIKALPEGSFVKYGVPMFTIRNTHKKFGWVTNMVETVTSAEMWQPITSATTYMAYKMLATQYAIRTGTPLEFVPYQLHDFSLRGMAGIHAGAKSGFSVLACGGIGTDCIPAIDIAEDYYYADADKEIIGQSVNATEHSVASSNIIMIEEALMKSSEWNEIKSELNYKKLAETEFVLRMIRDVYPEGYVSLVSDTFDFWTLVSEIIPKLKNTIMSRNGKVIIRPDSGDPVRIICGDEIEEITGVDCIGFAERIAENIIDERVRRETPRGACGPNKVTQIFKFLGDYYEATVEFVWNLEDGEYYRSEYDLKSFDEIELTAEQKGLVECLWETFGGEKTSTGHKLLDSHIGAIYGDSITFERATEIFRRLNDKGFASGNIVLGIGSYTFQLVTRDTHGMAMKSTHAIIDGNNFPIFKDPKTDNGTKKSAKGYMAVYTDEDGNYYMEDMVSLEESENDEMITVFVDSMMCNEQSLAEIRERTKIVK